MTQAIQRESNKVGLKRILDLALVPSSIIRFAIPHHKNYEELRQRANTKQCEGIPSLSTTIKTRSIKAMKAVGYISATGGELMRLTLYYNLAEYLHKTINSQT